MKLIVVNNLTGEEIRIFADKVKYDENFLYFEYKGKDIGVFGKNHFSYYDLSALNKFSKLNN